MPFQLTPPAVKAELPENNEPVAIPAPHREERDTIVFQLNEARYRKGCILGGWYLQSYDY